MIQFVNVTKRYPNEQNALSKVNFVVPDGELVFITGHSGAGKSTLLKLIAKIELPTIGDIIINGKNINRFSKNDIPAFRRQIGIIFQNPMLLEDRSVFENIALPLVIDGKSHSEIKRRVRAALDKVGLLKKENSFPSALSCGEQQRIGIARAIVSKPKLILADEPTGNVDPELSSNIMRLFEQFNQVGVTIMIATHDFALINKMKHRILTLHNGEIIADKTGESYVCNE